MVINIKAKSKDSSENDIRETIRESLERELKVARYKSSRYIKMCTNFEDKYKKTSEEFLSEFENVKLNEDDDFFDWYAAKRGADIWRKTHRILAGILI